MANHQRGFIALPIMAWVAIAASVAFIGMGVMLKVQSARLETTKAKLETCTTKYAETLKSIEKQNKAVEIMEIDAKKRTRTAAAALAKARTQAGSLDSEIQRLKAAKPADCAAAVAEVRKGMQP